MALPHRYILQCTVVLALLALLCTACFPFEERPKQPVKAPPQQQTYTIPEVGISEFQTLDPALVYDRASTNAISMIYSGLVQTDSQLRIRPQLAKAWQQGSDGTTWTFQLKPGLKFSDGKPLTAKDVAYSLDRALQPATQSTVAPIYLDLIKGSDQLLAGRTSTLIGSSLITPDDNTLVIITKKKAAYFLAMLTHPSAYVVEKSLIKKYGNKFTAHLNEGGGSGPFKVTSYTRGQGITFAPNTYYNGAKPQLQKVTVAFYTNAEANRVAYLNRQADSVAVSLATLAEDKKRTDFHQVPQLWTNYYSMNYLVKPFDNVHIRQAFALAINKQLIADLVWKGTAQPINTIVPQGLVGYNPELTGPDGTRSLKGNQKKAQELLKQGLTEQGWGDVSQMPPITLTYAQGVPQLAQEAGALVEMWKQVLKVNVVANAIDLNTLLDQVTLATGNPEGLQFWGLSWVGKYPDPQDWLTLQFGKDAPNNNMNYGQNIGRSAASQQVTQQSLEQADSEETEAERLRLYQQAEQQLVNDVAWLPMEQMKSTFLRTPNIVGIVDNAQGMIAPDDWSRIYRVQ